MRERPFRYEHDFSSFSPVEERLLVQLQIVNERLHIVEQRHNLLILIGSAALALLLTLVTSTTDPNPRYGMGFAATVILAGVLVSVASFFPQFRFVLWFAGRKQSPATGDDLYSFESISRYQPDALVRAVEERYLEIPSDEVEISAGETDLARVVIVNSRNAEIRTRLFDAAMILLAIGGLIALGSALVALVT